MLYIIAEAGNAALCINSVGYSPQCYFDQFRNIWSSAIWFDGRRIAESNALLDKIHVGLFGTRELGTNGK